MIDIHHVGYKDIDLCRSLSLREDAIKILGQHPDETFLLLHTNLHCDSNFWAIAGLSEFIDGYYPIKGTTSNTVSYEGCHATCLFRKIDKADREIGKMFS